MTLHTLHFIQMDHQCHWCQFKLSVTNVIDILDGTKVNRTNYGALLAETSSLTVTVHIIRLTNLRELNFLAIEAKS